MTYQKSPFTEEQQRWIIRRFGDLDYWLWGAADQHLKVTRPQNIEELIEHVNDFAKSIPKQDVYKAVKDIYVRAGCCLENGGAAFESRLKKYKKK